MQLSSMNRLTPTAARRKNILRILQVGLALLTVIAFLLPMFQISAMKGLGQKNAEGGNGITMYSLSSTLQDNIAKAIRKAKLPEGAESPIGAQAGVLRVTGLCTLIGFLCAIVLFLVTYTENLGVTYRRFRKSVMCVLCVLAIGCLLGAILSFTQFSSHLQAAATAKEPALEKLTNSFLSNGAPPTARVSVWAYVGLAGLFSLLMTQIFLPDMEAGRRPSLLWFALPAFGFYVALVIAPSLSSIYLGFTSWDGITDASMRFIGLDNYRNILQSTRFWAAAKNTLLIAALFTVLVNVLALTLAVAVDKVARAKNIFRSAFYVPVLISGIIAGFVWKIMFNYSFGVINHVLGLVGLSSVKFLDIMPNALLSIIFVLLWQSAGYYMIIYLAALQGIPVELTEAARIDGANSRQAFRHITIPLLAGSFTINLTLALINGMKIFDQIAVMTDGGPGFSTETITYMVYKVAFGEMRQGYGTSLAVILFLVIMVFGGLQVTMLRKREVQL